ncbi:hypothetical protein BUE80_DR009190 [Diplocarpon rosae]|nr:hypothetical protein BUE80_DR009190 [Diplocarpon rosae]
MKIIIETTTEFKSAAIGNFLKVAVAAVSWGSNRLDIFRTGDRASDLQHNWWDGSKWNGFESFGGVFTSPIESVSWSPGPESYGKGTLSVVGRGTDSAYWIKHYDNGWTGWTSLGGTFISEPSIVSWGSGRLDLFGIGSNGALYHKYFSGGKWSADWENLGGVLISAPTSVSWGSNRLDIFALGTDDAVWHKWWSGSAWGGWERLG